MNTKQEEDVNWDDVIEDMIYEILSEDTEEELFDDEFFAEEEVEE